MFKVNIKNTRMPSINSFQCQQFIIDNFEYISHLSSNVSVVDLEQVNVNWVDIY